MPKTYCTEANEVFPIKVGTDEASDGMELQTFWNAFSKTREDYGDKLAYCACEQKQTDTGYYTSGSLEQKTFNETYADAHSFGRALIATGLKKYQSVNIIGFNSYQWVIADIGGMMASALAAMAHTVSCTCC